MSFVTTVMISVPYEDDATDIIPDVDIKKISPGCSGGKFKWNTERNTTAPQANAWDHWGGGRVPHADILAGAFNYLDEDEFFNWLSSLPWSNPEFVQVFIMSEHDDKFRVLDIYGKD